MVLQVRPEGQIEGELVQSKTQRLLVAEICRQLAPAGVVGHGVDVSQGGVQ